MYKRGDIVWVNLGTPVGSEQGGIRPCLIVQNDIGNAHSPCIIVLPITKSTTKHHIPTQCIITVDGTWSIAYGEQIRTIDKKRITAKGLVDNISDMRVIDRALCVSMGLRYVV
jgi:mRNA interferase MazF